VDALVWEDLCRLLNEPEAIRFALERAHGGHWLPQDLQARRAALRRGQASVQQQIERLTEAYLAGVVGLDEFRRRRDGLDQKGQALDAQLRQLEAQVDRQTELARVGLSTEAFCRRVRAGLDQATWEQKRQLIEGLVVRVVVTESQVEIRYVIPTSPQGEATRFCHLRSHYRGHDQPVQARDRGRAALAHRCGSGSRTGRGRPCAQPHVGAGTPEVCPHRLNADEGRTTASAR